MKLRLVIIVIVLVLVSVGTGAVAVQAYHMSRDDGAAPQAAPSVALQDHAHAPVVPEQIAVTKVTEVEKHIYVLDSRNTCPTTTFAPRVVPERIIVHVWDRFDAPVRPEIIAAMQEAVASQMPGLPITLIHDDQWMPTLSDTEMHIPLVVYDGLDLVWYEDGKDIRGMSCNGWIGVEHMDGSPEVFKATVLHEIGHVLGLRGHTDGTLMEEGLSESEAVAGLHWDADQLEHLLAWSHTGASVPRLP